MAISEQTKGCVTIIFWIAGGLSVYGLFRFGDWMFGVWALGCFLAPPVLFKISEWGDPGDPPA